MGEPTWLNAKYPEVNKLLQEGILWELKHLSTLSKRKKIDSLSSGERTGKSPNQKLVSGVADIQYEEVKLS